MSPQHDFVIDNSTGANVRADINSVLQAIASNNSGSSAPSTTYALQTFANTTTSKLQLRNAANNAFVNLRGFDGSIEIPDGTASAPSLFLSDDTNTGLFTSGDDCLNITTGGTQRFMANAAGRVVVGNLQTLTKAFTVNSEAHDDGISVLAGNNNQSSRVSIQGKSIGGTEHNWNLSVARGSDFFGIDNGVSTFLGIEDAGNVGIGQTSPSSFDSSANLLVVGTTSGNNGITIVAGSSNHSSIYFADGTSGGSQKNAGIVDYNHSTDTMRFATAANNAMVIDSDQDVHIGTDSLGNDFSTFEIASQNRAILHTGTNSTSAQNIMFFKNPNGAVGSVQVNGSSTSFLTSSDYRLKENATAIADGITRLKTLKPYRFNFKTDASTTLDGFFAHEVTAVPEAISGTKDQVDSENNPIYQGIDQSKLVPLLVAAVQELIGKVEALEAA